MPTRKIADPPKFCQNNEHNPPSMMVYEPGTYEHTCPGCGAKCVFTVPELQLMANSRYWVRRTPESTAFMVSLQRLNGVSVSFVYWE